MLLVLKYQHLRKKTYYGVTGTQVPTPHTNYYTFKECSEREIRIFPMNQNIWRPDGVCDSLMDERLNSRVRPSAKTTGDSYEKKRWVSFCCFWMIILKLKLHFLWLLLTKLWWQFNGSKNEFAIFRLHSWHWNGQRNATSWFYLNKYGIRCWIDITEM